MCVRVQEVGWSNTFRGVGMNRPLTYLVVIVELVCGRSCTFYY